MRLDLDSLEKLLYRLITAPSGVAEGLAREESLRTGGLADLIVGDERLSAEQRVDIYANMYFYRLFDLLREDFPATVKLLGADNFHNLVTGYLVEHPPEHYSVLYAGNHLADYLRTHPMAAEFPFIPDLAALERSLIDVFHAPDAVALDAGAMRAVAPADWPTLQLGMHPAARLLDLNWNVAELLHAIEMATDDAAPQATQVTVLVWRDLGRVHYRELGSPERAALRLLSAGISFAEACAEIAANSPSEGSAADSPVAEVNRLLALWLADGLLVRI